MIISLNIDEIIQIKNLANLFNDEIKNGIDMADRVISHDDWNCKERDLIKENIIQMKRQLKITSEKADSFSRALTQSAQMFTDTSSMLLAAIRKVDGSVSTALSIPSAGNVTPVDSRFNNMIGDITSNVMSENAIDNYIIEGFKSTIKICDFSDLDLKG